MYSSGKYMPYKTLQWLHLVSVFTSISSLWLLWPPESIVKKSLNPLKQDYTRIKYFRLGSAPGFIQILSGKLIQMKTFWEKQASIILSC